MRSDVRKLRIVNGILAARSDFGSDMFLQANCALDFALSQNAELNAPRDFARAILKMYSPDSTLEYLDMSGAYFDPLFALATINDAIKRLAGCKKPILIVEGLDKSTVRGGKRWSAKKRIEYAENLSTVEGIVLRYESCLPNLEIIFV